MNASHTGVYQVVRLDPGRGVELENMLEGGRVFVHDRGLSLSAGRWVLLFGRVYTTGPYVFPTAAGLGYPPQQLDYIRYYLDRQLGRYQRRYPGAGWSEFLKMKAE